MFDQSRDAPQWPNANPFWRISGGPRPASSSAKSRVEARSLLRGVHLQEWLRPKQKQRFGQLFVRRAQPRAISPRCSKIGRRVLLLDGPPMILDVDKSPRSRGCAGGLQPAAPSSSAMIAGSSTASTHPHPGAVRGQQPCGNVSMQVPKDYEEDQKRRLGVDSDHPAPDQNKKFSR